MKNSFLIILLLSLISVGCNLELSGQYTYQHPQPENDGIEVGTLHEVNIDSTLIKLAVNKILNGQNHTNLRLRWLLLLFP